MSNFLIIIFSVLLNASAQLFLKRGAETMSSITTNSGAIQLIEKVLNVPMLAGLGCYAISIIAWVYALSKVDVSYAYPFQALGYVVVALAAYFLFNEALSLQKLIGIALITAGVVCIARCTG